MADHQQRSGAGRPRDHRVLLVHGIRTDAGWYETAVERLRPFFECIEYKYDGYRHHLWGAPRLLVDPRALLVWTLVALLAAVGAFLAFDKTWLRIVVPLVVLAFGLGMALHRAARQLRATVEAFSTFYGTRVHRPGRPPHLIAHSLGTYLSGTALERFGVRYNRVVYCAAVLPRHFNWHRAHSGSRFRRLRNETGLEDYVPKAAWALSALRSGFGEAGRHGFAGPGGVVHTVPDQNFECPSCGEVVAPVHNLPLPFEHSDYFVGSLQCENYWLPFLLGYDPAEYRLLMDMCAELSQLDGIGHDEARDELEAQLRGYEWKWLRGGTLDGFARRFVERSYSHLGGDLAWLLTPYILHAIGLFWRQIAAAQTERDKDKYQPPWVVTGMDPLWVLLQALRRVT